MAYTTLVLASNIIIPVGIPKNVTAYIGAYTQSRTEIGRMNVWVFIGQSLVIY